MRADDNLTATTGLDDQAVTELLFRLVGTSSIPLWGGVAVAFRDHILAAVQAGDAERALTYPQSDVARLLAAEARQGRVGAVVMVCHLMREAGRFKGLQRKEARRAVGRALAGCDPDKVSEGWARFVLQGGLR